MDEVLGVTYEDEDRLRNMINEMIESGELKSMPKFVSESKSKRNRRRKAAEREAKVFFKLFSVHFLGCQPMRFCRKRKKHFVRLRRKKELQVFLLSSRRVNKNAKVLHLMRFVILWRKSMGKEKQKGKS